MTDEQLLRYSRHVLLDGIGIEGQRKLLAAHVLVIGAGGLGCPVGLYLASAGVGRITLVDPDQVDATNLQRQIAHTQSRVGWPKVHSLQAAMAAINPDITIEAVAEKADAHFLAQKLPQVDVVVDCTDNFLARHSINQACVVHQKPLVFGSAIRFDGQVCTFDLRQPHSACYACLFPMDANQPVEEACATMGVFAPLVGIVGSMQAAETIKLLCGQAQPATQTRLVMVDALNMAFENIQFARQHSCTICSTGAICLQ